MSRVIGPLSAVVIRRDVLIRAGLFCPMQFNGEDWTTFVNVCRLTDWHFIRRRLGFTRFLRSSGTYEQAGSLMLLATQVNAWYGGRPLRRHTNNLEFTEELDHHRLRLRFEIQHFFWDAIRHRRWRLARLVWGFGSLLLLRTTDRLYVLLPPPLTWRIEHWAIRRGSLSSRASGAGTPIGVTDS